MITRSLVALTLLLCLVPAGRAQEAAPQKKVTLNFRAVPLRSALELLFQGTGYQYAVQPEVPNVPVTLNIRDQPFEFSLRTLLRLAGADANRELTVRREADRYLIEAGEQKVPPMDPAGREEYVLQKVPLNYSRAEEFLGRMDPRLIPPNVLIQPIAIDNSLLVQGTREDIAHLKSLARFSDFPAKMLVLRAGVSCTGPDGKPLEFASMARCVNGQRLVLDDTGTAPGRAASVKVTLRPIIGGDGMILVDSEWDVSVPVAGGSKGPVLLVKRLSTTMRIPAGQRAAVGQVDASAWGGKGKVELWIEPSILPDPLAPTPLEPRARPPVRR